MTKQRSEWFAWGLAGWTILAPVAPIVAAGPTKKVASEPAPRRPEPLDESVRDIRPSDETEAESEESADDEELVKIPRPTKGSGEKSTVAVRAFDQTRTLTSPLPASMPRPEGDAEALPIDWPTVLELARASNIEIEIAAEKVHESHVTLGLAKQQWIPSLRIGSSWLHHEGRIQDIPGQIIDTSKSSLFAGGIMQMNLDPQKVAIDVLRAKQAVYSRSGELDRATRETLQESSLAYLDLVAAQGGAAISIEIAELIGELLDRSAELLKQGVGTQVDVLRNKAQHQSQLQTLINSRQNQLAASARLVQLLKMKPGTRLFAAEDQLTPVTLVDETQTEEELIRQALNQGPGLAEVVSIIAALEQQQRQLSKIGLLPQIQIDVGQGAFGGGFGGSYRDFDSRTDTGVNVYWDLMKIAGTAQTRELFESKKRQATLSHEQLTNKLAAGVIVARNAANKARERITLSQTEIETAVQSYELSNARLKAAETLSFEVLQAIGSLGAARANYVRAVIEYNQAQIRLQYLIGFCQGSEIPEVVTKKRKRLFKKCVYPQQHGPLVKKQEPDNSGLPAPMTVPPSKVTAATKSDQAKPAAPVQSVGHWSKSKQLPPITPATATKVKDADEEFDVEFVAPLDDPM